VARVFLGRHPTTGELVAVKVVPTDRPAGAAEGLLAEADACAAMDHPNVVRAVTAGREGGFVYLVLEYVEGLSLGGLVRAAGPLDHRVAAGYARQAAEGLAHVHARGWVHGDVKPDNLLLTPDSAVKVIDLGMASRQADRGEGLFRGTLEFAAPEIIRRRVRPDARADVYSLGATLYFLLTGRSPRPSPGAEGLVLSVLAPGPRPRLRLGRRVPAGLAGIVRRMLFANPSRRYQRSDDVVVALTGWIGSDPLVCGARSTALPWRPGARPLGRVTRPDDGRGGR
jgi:serine/threonine-protein kinase